MSDECRFDMGWCLTHHRNSNTCTIGFQNRIAALESELTEARQSYVKAAGERNALRGELAAKGRELEAERQLNKLEAATRKDAVLRAETIEGLLDRERSRREALERELRRYLETCTQCGVASDVRAILDRSAEQDSGSSQATTEAEQTCSGNVDSPEHRLRKPEDVAGNGVTPRTTQARTQSKSWFGDEFRPRRAEQDSKGGDADAGSEGDPVVHKVAQTEPDSTSDSVDADCPRHFHCEACGTFLTNPTLGKLAGNVPYVDACAFCPTQTGADLLAWIEGTAPEPRMSVSEAHLSGLLREARAEVWDEAERLAQNTHDVDGSFLAGELAHVYRRRAAAVRRGEA